MLKCAGQLRSILALLTADQVVSIAIKLTDADIQMSDIFAIKLRSVLAAVMHLFNQYWATLRGHLNMGNTSQATAHHLAYIDNGQF